MDLIRVEPIELGISVCGAGKIEHFYGIAMIGHHTLNPSLARIAETASSKL